MGQAAAYHTKSRPWIDNLVAQPMLTWGRPIMVLTWAQLGESTFGLAHKGMPLNQPEFFSKVKKCGKNCKRTSGFSMKTGSCLRVLKYLELLVLRFCCFWNTCNLSVVWFWFFLKKNLEPMEKFSDSDFFEIPKTATVLSSWYGLLNIPDWSWYWGCVFPPIPGRY